VPFIVLLSPVHLYHHMLLDRLYHTYINTYIHTYIHLCLHLYISCYCCSVVDIWCVTLYNNTIFKLSRLTTCVVVNIKASYVNSSIYHYLFVGDRKLYLTVFVLPSLPNRIIACLNPWDIN